MRRFADEYSVHHDGLLPPYTREAPTYFERGGKKALFEVFKFLGVGDIAYNQSKSLPYPTEKPWA